MSTRSVGPRSETRRAWGALLALTAALGACGLVEPEGLVEEEHSCTRHQEIRPTSDDPYLNFGYEGVEASSYASPGGSFRVWWVEQGRHRVLQGDTSPAAGVPSVELCMGCHAQFPKEYDEIEGIRILKQHWEDKTPIEWVQIHRLPEYVQFRHNRHIAAGVECQRCHGQVEEMDKLYLVPESFWRNGVPVNKLEMGWCINCHRENHNQADIDCVRCHY